MTAEQFCYWLQGRAELQPDNPPSADEWRAIAGHLALVFKKVTPPQGLPWTPSMGSPGMSPNWARQSGPPARAECLAAGNTE